MNRVRGDVAITLDGVTRRLRLTFGALAEIEAALKAESISEVGVRLARLTADEMMAVLGALLRGAGEDDAAARIDASRVDLREVSRGVAEAFRAALE